MSTQGKKSLINVAPVAGAGIIAALGLGALFFMDFGPKNEIQPRPLTMRTASVVDRAGATTIPTQPDNPDRPIEVR